MSSVKGSMLAAKMLVTWKETRAMYNTVYYISWTHVFTISVVYYSILLSMV